MVYDDSVFYFYVNGKQAGTCGAKNATDISTTLSMVIGGAAYQDGQPVTPAIQGFKGIIDEVRVYDIALGKDTVKQMYKQEKLVMPADSLLVWYSFNNGLQDESGNGFDATANGGALVDDSTYPLNKVYSFDGVNDYLNVGDSTALQLTDSFSIQMWVNPNGYTDQDIGIIINKEGEYDIRISYKGYLYYVLELLKATNYINNEESSLYVDSEEIMRLLPSIIKSTKSNLKN